MADATRPALGLSIGATNLAAVTAERALTRKPVLTLYGQRAPEVGVPAENPQLAEPGLVITDFVNRVGSPARVVAADGSAHRSEVLVADALRALADAATEGQPVPEAVVVSYPAHWQPAAVEALRSALSSGAWQRDGHPVSVDDAAAAVTAWETNPGIPATGVIAVCDFGGSGSSLTLVDAANGYQRMAPTVRHDDFSGDAIDQALLDHVVAELSAGGSFDTAGTSAIGSITRLRADCRRAKEQLSSTTVTTLTADLPGFHGDFHLTRAELDEAIRQPLESFVGVIRNTLQQLGIEPDSLAAVATLGGGANIPAITTTLSDQFGKPVITAPRPHLTAAIGAALRAAHGPVDQGATALAPTAGAVSPPAEPTAVLQPPPAAGGAPALAWSEAGDDSGIMPLLTGEYPSQSGVDETADRSPRRPDRDGGLDAARPAAVAWYQRPLVLIVGTALVLLAIAAAIMIALRHTSGGAVNTPTPGVSTAPTSTSAPGSQSPTQSQPSDSSQPPSQTSSTSTQPPSSSETTTTPPSSQTTTTPPSTTTQPSTSQVTTTQPPFPPNRPILPVFPRNPGGPEGPGTGGR